MAKKKLPVQKRAATPIPVQIVDRPSTSKPDKDYEARERKYRAEDALRDIERAEGHKRDGDLMKDVKELAKAKINSLSKVCK